MDVMLGLLLVLTLVLALMLVPALVLGMDRPGWEG